MERSIPSSMIWFVIIVFAMYGFVCRFVAKKIMKGYKAKSVFAVCWILGVIVFGVAAHLTSPDDPWLAGLIAGTLAAMTFLAVPW